MPPAAVGAAFVALGASAATGAAITALVTAAYVGAAVGAVVGAATSLITGGNPLKGALKGAVLGFVSGGVLKGVGMAMSGAGVAGEAGVAEAGMSTAGESVSAAGSAPAGLEAGVPELREAVAKNATVGTGTVAAPTPPPSVPPTGEGLLSNAMKWINANPNAASGIGQGLAGAGKAMLESRSTDKYIEALMERDRLNREALQVKGLDTLQIRMPLPSIAKFTERPSWRFPENGLIWEGAKNASKTA